MSATGPSIFDKTVHLSNLWLDELVRAIEWNDKYRTCRLLRAILPALRDRRTAREAVQFGAQLPMVIHGRYNDDWHMRDAPPSERTKSAFLSHIEAAIQAISQLRVPKHW